MGNKHSIDEGSSEFRAWHQVNFVKRLRKFRSHGQHPKLVLTGLEKIDGAIELGIGYAKSNKVQTAYHGYLKVSFSGIFHFKICPEGEKSKRFTLSEEDPILPLQHNENVFITNEANSQPDGGL